MNSDGLTIRRHVIKKGETLERIAKRYGFRDWRPIHIYNYKYKKTLSSQAGTISAGKAIFIPRSPAGYDKAIKKLTYLKSYIAATGDMEDARLEKEYNQQKIKELAVDTLSESLTFLATSMIKAGSAVKSFVGAINSSGSQSKAYSHLGNIALQKLDKQIWDKAYETSVKELSGVVLGDKAKEVVGDVQKYSSTYEKMGNAIKEHSFQGGKNLLNAADMILDYASPSKVAYIYCTLSEGGSLATAFLDNTADNHKSYKANINKTVQQSQLNLDNKIKLLTKEKADLYK